MERPETYTTNTTNEGEDMGINTLEDLLLALEDCQNESFVMLQIGGQEYNISHVALDSGEIVIVAEEPEEEEE